VVDNLMAFKSFQSPLTLVVVTQRIFAGTYIFTLCPKRFCDFTHQFAATGSMSCRKRQGKRHILIFKIRQLSEN
jgi:hypothetical protein